MKIKLLTMSMFALLASGLASCENEIQLPEDEPTIDEPTEDIGELNPTTLWVVGDSTVCDYGKYDASGNKTGVTDVTSFYDRYGYATQLENYLNNDLVTVKNLAMSGRSSLNFINEDNYTTLTEGIKKGDYLLIGFGHNDEKSDDSTRFSDATKPVTEKGSFKYNLYEYYCKMAIIKGATPILASPIVRLNKDMNFEGSNAHITQTGNYGNAIVELGTEKNIPVVDLTTKTNELYTELGYDEAIYFHAMSNGLDQTTPKLETVDNTHINIYGAKQVAYLLAKELEKTSSKLKRYLNEEIVAPTKEKDLVINPYFTYKPYQTPDLDQYKELIEAGTTNAEGVQNTNYYNYLKTKSDGWYGTVFGDMGGSGMSNGNGWHAEETETGVFKVGCEKNKGKIGSSEGFAMVFKKIDKNDNFVFTADVKVQLADPATMLTQGGFGIMLRDDIYVNQTSKDASIKSNSVSAGMYTSSSGTNIVYSREASSLTKANQTISGIYQAEDTAKLKIERVGQSVTATVIYKDVTYTQNYLDIQFTDIDNDFMYIGMYATRSTVCEFTNVSYQKTGTSQGA